MHKTKIDTADVRIGNRDESIQALAFNHNIKVFYLPIFPAEKFPNLEAIHAGNCNVKEISKDNFDGLTKLRYIHLVDNNLKKIPGNTFEGLESIETIYLSNFSILS